MIGNALPLWAELRRHPKGLSYLFASEMWERFSFYGMRAILILYLVGELKMPREEASTMYAVYTSLVYLTPLIGGQIADCLLGRRKAVLVGGIVMALGHFAMAIPSLLYSGLGLLIIGNGFFKPNISSQVGDLYEAGDTRQERGYMLFYAGINLGAVFSPLVCGTLGQKVGWHVGFAAAGIGMLVALLTFVRAQKHLGSAGWVPGDVRPNGDTFNARDWQEVLVWSIAAPVTVQLFLLLAPIYSPALGALGLFFYRLALVGALSLLVAKAIKRRAPRASESLPSLSATDRQCVAAVAVMTCFSVLFCMAFEQAGNSMALFADQNTRCEILGYQFPSSWFQALNPLFVIVFTWLSSLLPKPFPYSVYSKQGIGLLVLGVGCLVMYQANLLAGADGGAARVSPWWLIATFLIFTLSELMISPVGLSLVKKLAPDSLVSTLMGIAFVGVYAGNYLAGTLESILKEIVGGAGSLWPALGLVCFLGGAFYLTLVPLLKRMSSGREV